MSSRSQSGYTLYDVRRDDRCILVTGNTGSGKSSFIQSLVRDKVDIGDGLASVTRTIKLYPCDGLHDQRIWFIDTVAFDDQEESAYEVITDLVNFLCYAYIRGLEINAVLHLQKITDVRFSASSRSSLDILAALLGESAYHSLCFMTTFWEALRDQELGERRQQEIQQNFWQPFLARGGNTYSLGYGPSPLSAREIVQSMIQDRVGEAVPFQIQVQYVDERRSLVETDVGRGIARNLHASRDQAHRMLSATRAELVEDLKGNAALHSLLTSEVRRLEGKSEQLDNLTKHLATLTFDRNNVSRARYPSNKAESLSWKEKTQVVGSGGQYHLDHTLETAPNLGQGIQGGTEELVKATEHSLSPEPIEEIIIAVMGITGCGKSTFVQLFTDEAVPTSSGVESYTKEITMYRCSIPGVPKLFLIDTPGFDDTNRSDADVLRQLADFLAAMWSSQVVLTGIVYMHSIMDNRFGAAADRNLGMFKKLCGQKAMSSVVLVTSFWDLVKYDAGVEREKGLREGEQYWAGMIQRGSETFRQDNGKTSGEHILQRLIQRQKQVVLYLQEELVDQRKSLAQTSAGRLVALQLVELRQEYQMELTKLREQHRRALEEQDAAWQEKIVLMKKHYETGLTRQSQTVSSSNDVKNAGEGHRFETTNISGNARAVLGNVTRNSQQTFYINNATLVFGDKGDYRGLKRFRKRSDDSDVERERIRSVLREFLSA